MEGYILLPKQGGTTRQQLRPGIGARFFFVQHGRTLSIYDSYATIYDTIGQGQFGAEMARWTLDWLAGQGVMPAHALDLACGNGAAALVFTQAGCEVVGLDRSAAMLEIARGKARDAGLAVVFVEADMRAIPMGDDRPTTDARRLVEMQQSSDGQWPPTGGAPSFDLVTCFADSINYMIGDGDLACVFRGVRRLLRPGGFFMFDINTEAEYATWDERDVVIHDSPDILVYNRLEYDVESRLGTGRIVWFTREIERWWRDEETHIQRAWSEQEVRDALSRTGLDVQLVEPVQSATDNRRVVWVVRRG